MGRLGGGGGGGDEGDEVELAGVGVDEQAVDGDVFGDERVVLDHGDGGADAGGRGVESSEPGLKVDAGVGEGGEGGVWDAGVAGVLEDFVVGHAGNAAVVVADDENFFSAERVDGHEDGAHDGAERSGDDGAGDFDDFGVAVFEVHGLGQKLGQARIHAGDDDDFFVGEAVREEGLVGFGGDELGVEREDVGKLGHEDSVADFGQR